jgi:oxygen-independent coproporphyrinogen-3 oxidase
MLDAIRWDTDLIRRYDLAGPRYTSYPTAVQFNSQVGTFDLLHALRDSRKAAPAVAVRARAVLRQHLLLLRLQQGHHQGSRPRQPYLQRLEQEIQLIACHLDPAQKSSNCTSAAAPRPSSATTNCAS